MVGNQTALDRTKFTVVWGVLPAHDQAADNTIALVNDPHHLHSDTTTSIPQPDGPQDDALTVSQLPADDHDDTPLHHRPELYRGNESQRGQSIARWHQLGRVQSATAAAPATNTQSSPPTAASCYLGGTTQPFSMTAATGGADLPACPEFYWTSQLEHHNPNQEM